MKPEYRTPRYRLNMLGIDTYIPTKKTDIPEPVLREMKNLIKELDLVYNIYREEDIRAVLRVELEKQLYVGYYGYGYKKPQPF